MIGGSHVAIANLCYLALGLVSERAGLTLPVDWQHLAVASLAAVVADIDNATSWLGLQVPLAGRLLERWLGRRGWMHTVWAALLFGVLWLPFGLSLAVASLAGYLSHLFLDAFTEPGLQPWRPYKGFGGIALFRSGGFWDLVIGMTATITSWVLLVQRVGSPAVRALEAPLTWAAVLVLVALLPGWLLSGAIRRI